jgi:hypothetical protein
MRWVLANLRERMLTELDCRQTSALGAVYPRLKLLQDSRRQIGPSQHPS